MTTSARKKKWNLSTDLKVLLCVFKAVCSLFSPDCFIPEPHSLLVAARTLSSSVLALFSHTANPTRQPHQSIPQAFVSGFWNRHKPITSYATALAWNEGPIHRPVQTYHDHDRNVITILANCLGVGRYQNGITACNNFSRTSSSSLEKGVIGRSWLS